jgi:hypothetical protein
MTSKQTTKQHLLLGNRFLITKYTQPLLGGDLETNTLPGKRLEYNNEQCFLHGPCRDVTIETSLVVSCKGVYEEKKTWSVKLKNLHC